MMWKGDKDDLTCKIRGYTLRVEKMDKGRWWWCVYEGDTQMYQAISSSKQHAIGSCEGYYFGRCYK